MSTSNNKENMEIYQLDYVGDKNNETQHTNDCGINETITNDGNNKEKPSDIVVKHCESESLKSILIYDSSSDDDDSSSTSTTTESETEISSNLWRSKPNTSSSSSSSSSSIDSEEDDDDDIAIIENSDNCTSNVEQQGQSKGAIKRGTTTTTRKKPTDDLDIDDLPPVPDLSTLNINVENEKFVLIGHIYNIIDRLITVTSLPNMPAYDLDTIFFLDNGKKPLGLVFDVLGQVTSPMYAIRFNHTDDIKNLNIKVGLEVFVAPTSQHTQYVFLQQLLKLKGSDASWFDDREVPVEFVDYSDDESEFYQRTKQTRIQPHSKRSHDCVITTTTTTTTTSSSSVGDCDAYKRYETTMNKRNLLNTKLNTFIDTYKQQKIKRQLTNFKTNNNQNTTIRQIHFDPTVPPPNMQSFLGYTPPLSSVTSSSNNNNNNNNCSSGGASSVWQQPNYFNFIPNSMNYFAMPPPPPPPVTTAAATTTTTTTNIASSNSPGPSYK